MIKYNVTYMKTMNIISDFNWEDIFSYGEIWMNLEDNRPCLKGHGLHASNYKYQKFQLHKSRD